MTKPIPADIIKLDNPETVGNFPIRSELTVLAADDPTARTIGWTVQEFIGVAVVCPKPTVWRRLRLWFQRVFGKPRLPVYLSDRGKEE